MAKSPYIRSKRPSGRTKPRKLESPIHIGIVNYLNLAYGARKDVYFLHVPNGGSRHPAEAAELKRMGTKPGVSDLLIFRGMFPHWLEIKSEDGVVSDYQDEFLLVVGMLGHKHAVVRSVLEAKDVIDGWLR